MKQKKVFCYINQDKDQIIISAKCVNITTQPFYKSIPNSLLKKISEPEFEVEHQFKISGMFTGSSKLEEMAYIGRLIKNELEIVGYSNASFILNVDVDFIFTSELSLPKISASKLNSSFKQKLENKYGDQINKFYYQYTKKINESKGYDFDILFIERLKYQKLLGIFTLQKFKIESVYLLPSLYKNLFISKELIDKSHCAYLMEEEKTRFCLYHNKKIVFYQEIKGGFLTPEKMIAQKYEWPIDQARELCIDEPTRVDVSDAVFKSMKPVTEIIYQALMENPEILQLDQIMINCRDTNPDYLLAPFHRLFKSDLTILFEDNPRYQKNILIYLSLVNPKNLFLLPQRVK